jgi:lytic cellulose monooxygenase (C1-hydroxylating)
LIANNNTVSVTIPKNLKSGRYVLRNEIIALHTAGTVGGAQNYPQCFSLEVTGGGSKELPVGVEGTKFYKPAENGIVFNIARVVESGGYKIPGPPLVKI